MVGRNIGDVFNNLSRNDKIGEVVLEAKGLENDYIKDVNFTLRKGEVLGFAGLVGAGRSETIRAISALTSSMRVRFTLMEKSRKYEAPGTRSSRVSVFAQKIAKSRDSSSIVRSGKT